MKERFPEKSFEKKNILLSLKLMRHGERTLKGALTNYGRRITRELAQNAEIPENLTGVKAVGSTTGPKGRSGMPRSLETAHLFAEEIGKRGVPQYQTRMRPLLGYEAMNVPEPFDWAAYYNEHAERAAQELYGKPFSALTAVERAEAGHVAETACVDRLLKDPAGKEFTHKAASTFAFIVDRYARMADRLKNESRVLYVGGTHGGLIEPFLREVLVRKLPDGEEIRGFDNVEDIGGAFRASESFTINVEIDNEGRKSVSISFDNPDRPSAAAMHLDLPRLNELVESYHHSVQERDEGQ